MSPMATLGLSVGFTYQNNFVGRKSVFSREIYGKRSFFGYERKKVTKTSGVKAIYDYIPKQFREENLKDGVMKYFKNVPEELFDLPSKDMERLTVGDASDTSQDGQAFAESLSMSSFCNSSFWSKQHIVNSGINMRAAGASGEESYGRYSRQESRPPDLPSLLLANRIIYLNVPLYDEITELVLAELMWLGMYKPRKPIFLYIDSTGTQNEAGEAVTLEYDAYAIGDMLNTLRCKKYTLNLAQASGQAAMLLSMGTKGCRYTQPGGVVKLYLPKAIPEGGQSTDMWIRAKELVNETDIFLKFLSQGIGKTKEELANDLVKQKVFNAEDAIQYGIVDKIMKPEKALVDGEKYDAVSYEEKLRQMKARKGKRKRRRNPAMAH